MGTFTVQRLLNQVPINNIISAPRLDYLILSASPVAIAIADISVINLSALDACICTRKGVF
jgi:hypothetical protein